MTVDEALALVLALATPPQPEEAGLAEAAGRVLAADAVSRMTQPPFDAAAMDGYAVRGADLPGPLAVIGEAAAGRGWAGRLGRGQAIRIFTGAPVPDGADLVVMQEDTDRTGDLVTARVPRGNPNIHRRGNDFAAGDRIAAGRRLSAADVALLAAMNLPRVTVARAPVVAVLAGGDELVVPGADPGPGQIISSNDLAIAALARSAGGVPRILPLARDTQASLRDGFAAARGADLIVTIGGASVGDHDLIGSVAAELGMTRAFHRIAMRPGKPLMAGRLGGVPMLGLPGNPVSAIVTAILFMQPLLRRMQGDARPTAPVRRAALGIDLPAEGNRQHYLRAALAEGPGGAVITPFADQDSARLSLLAGADALLIRPAGDPPRRAAEPVCYLPLPH